MLEPDVERMAGPSIGTRARDLASLLEMAGRPDAQRFTDSRRSPGPTLQVVQVGRAISSAATATTNPSVTRRRTRNAVMRSFIAAPWRRRQTTLDSLDHLGQLNVVDAGERCAGSVDDTGTNTRRCARRRCRPRTRDRCVRRESDRTARRAACRPPPPMCNGPVSPKSGCARACAIANRSVIDVAGAASAAPLDARETCCASDCSPGPHRTSERSPNRSRIAAASAPKRSAGHRLFGHAAPGLITAYGAPSESGAHRVGRRAVGNLQRKRTRTSRGCRAARAAPGS